FPPETVSRADRAYQWLMSRSDRCDVATRAWLGVAGACLAALLFFSWRGRRAGPRGLVLWMPAMALLGPIGLLAWSIAVRGQWRGAEAAPVIWRRALGEVIGDLPPDVVGLVVALLAAFVVPELSGSSLIQLLVICGLPLVGGLFLFHGPLLAYATRSGYGRIVIRRFPAALVSTNLSLAGMVAVAAPLIAWCANYCGFGALAVPRLWAMAVLGALVGGLPLYAYHVWAVRQGYAAWSALLWGTSEAGDGTPAVSTPSWRRLWLWALVSFVALVAGVALGVMGTALTAGLR
ncbi:MAG: hypothetical protein JSV36_13490, partial [Anaerolineae bacterium]